MQNSSQIFQIGFLNNTNNYLHSLRSSRCFNKTIMKAYSNQYETQESLLSQTHKKIVIGTPKKKQQFSFPSSKEMTTGSKNEFNMPFFNQNIFMHFVNEKGWDNKENSNIPSNLLFTSSGENKDGSNESYSTNSFNFQRKRDTNQNLLTTCKINLHQIFNTDHGENIFGKFRAESYHSRLISDSSSPSKYSKGDSTVSLSFSSEDTNLHQTSSNDFNGNQNSHIEKHQPLFKIPKERRNDENYKLLAIRKIRKPIFKNNKSTSKFEASTGITFQANPFFSNFEQPQAMSTECLYDYNILNGKRKKVVHSVKKYYASEIEFHDTVTKKNFYFNIYKDHEIGINSEWQRYIHECKEDEDIASDEEMIKNCGNFCRNEMQKAIQCVKSGEGFHQIANIQFL